MSSSSPAARTDLHVLVVDDHPDVRAMLVDMLHALGVATVVSAADGREALARLRGQPVDLVITDLAMPGMDGLELTRRLRAQPASARIPVVMVSGQAAEASQALEAGVSRFLAKPVRLHQLERTISELAGA